MMSRGLPAYDLLEAQHYVFETARLGPGASPWGQGRRVAVRPVVMIAGCSEIDLRGASAAFSSPVCGD
jgi:hypothetical protein